MVLYWQRGRVTVHSKSNCNPKKTGAILSRQFLLKKSIESDPIDSCSSGGIRKTENTVCILF